ncbi:MAG: glycosyltransferase family 4 protein [Azoarcus sp.]|jgi:phosphatidylinositol alpha-1,6-mannosyltransferase|nr:glycosyltransferase family 4 protein [Azoarcus sp.]
MKKLLLVTRNFPPLAGGMEGLNLHLAAELSRYCEVRVVAPEGAAIHAMDKFLVREVRVRPLSRFLLAAAWRTLREARGWRPDVVLAGSGLTAPIALTAARVCGARAAAYVHGLDVAVPHPVYRALWHPALRRLDIVIANSQATARLADAAGIVPSRVEIVHPGVSLPMPDSGARERFRQLHRLGDASVLLSVGRLTTRKGLREFVADVLPKIVACRPTVRLLIVGDAPTHSLYAECQSPESILAAARAAGVGEHLLFLGWIADERQLADAYAGADLHVFPVRHLPGDPEGFGMVAVEAAAQGLATVAYATGGVVDAVGEGVSGRLVAPGDDEAFARAALDLLENRLPADRVRQFAMQFAWPRFGEKLWAGLERQT